MPSRQMAFQLTQAKFREHLVTFFETYRTHAKGAMNVNDWVASLGVDEKTEKIYKAVFIVTEKCKAEGRDVLHVKRVTCWRDAAGKPNDIEILFDGRTRL